MDRYDTLTYKEIKTEASTRGVKATGAGRTRDVIVAELRALDRQQQLPTATKPIGREASPTGSTTPSRSPISPEKIASSPNAKKSPIKASIASNAKKSPIKASSASNTKNSPIRASIASNAKQSPQKAKLSAELNALLDRSNIDQTIRDTIQQELERADNNTRHLVELVVKGDATSIEELFRDEKTMEALYDNLPQTISALSLSSVLALGLLIQHGEQIDFKQLTESIKNRIGDLGLFVRSYDAARSLDRLIKSQGRLVNWIGLFQHDDRNVPLYGYLLAALIDERPKINQEALRLLFVPSTLTFDELNRLLPQLLLYPTISPSILLRLVLARRDGRLLKTIVLNGPLIDYLLTDVIDFSSRSDIEQNVAIVLQNVKELTMEDLNRAIEKARLSNYNNVVKTLINTKKELERQ